MSVSNKQLEVFLDQPICAYTGSTVAVEAPCSGRQGFCLVGHATISGGSCCLPGAEPSTLDSSLPALESAGESVDAVNDDEYNNNRIRFLDELSDKVEASDYKKISVPKPNVSKDGGSHYVIENFTSIAKALNRETWHLQAYLSKEAGLSCATAGENGAALRVRYRQRGFTELIYRVIRRYIAVYVSCQQCKCAKTEFLLKSSKNNSELLCRLCNARRFVPKL